MREIKFRAWMIGEKKMLSFDGPSYDLECEGLLFRCLNYSRIGKFEIMQSTGLKTADGKDVYEGDILGGIYDSQIKYCDKCMGFQIFFPSFGCAACEGDIQWNEVVEDNGKLEVIGNIWEHPELLK